jgi:hypothetical protein
MLELGVASFLFSMFVLGPIFLAIFIGVHIVRTWGDDWNVPVTVITYVVPFLGLSLYAFVGIALYEWKKLRDFEAWKRTFDEDWKQNDWSFARLDMRLNRWKYMWKRWIRGQRPEGPIHLV